MINDFQELVTVALGFVGIGFTVRIGMIAADLLLKVDRSPEINVYVPTPHDLYEDEDEQLEETSENDDHPRFGDDSAVLNRPTEDDSPQENTITDVHGRTREEVPDELPKAEKRADQRVVRTKTTGDKVYLLNLVDKTKRHVRSEEELTSLGYTFADVETITDQEFAQFSIRL